MPRSPRPGPHPLPSPDFARRDLPRITVGGPLFRVHRHDRGPLFFGKTGDNRFDDPRQGYGVLYAGLTEACAFIETFGEPLTLPAVSAALLRTRKLSRIEVLRPRELVDLQGANLRRAGADARLFAGEHAIARA